MTRIMGVDPSITACGWAVIDFYDDADANVPALVACGVIRSAGSAVVPGETKASRGARLDEATIERVRAIHSEFLAIAETYLAGKAGARIACEGPSLGYTPGKKAAHDTALVRGVALAAANASGARFAFYPPTTVKKCLTNNGRAEKEEVRAAVLARTGHTKPRLALDASDAVAVAITDGISRGSMRGGDNAKKNR